MSKISIEIVGNSFIVENWLYIKRILTQSFVAANFNNGYNTDIVLEEIESRIFKTDSDYNIVAFFNNEIAGCIFSIEPNAKSSEIYRDIGWLFTDSELNKKNRIVLAVKMVNEVHKLLKKLRYKFVYTEIGTKEGEYLLTKRFNYKRYSDNVWLKEL